MPSVCWVTAKDYEQHFGGQGALELRWYCERCRREIDPARDDLLHGTHVVGQEADGRVAARCGPVRQIALVPA